jgi:alkanesulfonate monooxygenase SsuD/methylene tetrahydromethanopterin reductase-like flavin-dependent oxidoreductase (luciferase family)
MDDVVNRFAKELADAIAAAVADNPQVEACRARAREAGFDMRVTLEAVVGFVNRTSGSAVTKITTPSRLLPAKRQFDLSSNDRRFLRSLRISADEAKEAVE